MLIGQARQVAADWVEEQASAELLGAFLTGSAAVGPAGRELAATSDVDVIMVVRGDAPAKTGKFWHAGVLLDVSSLSVAELDAETVAGTHFLAPFVTSGRVIGDRTGTLRRMQAEVTALADEPTWVRRRVADVRTRITSAGLGADPAAPAEAQLMGWVFPASLPAVLLLVAAGRPPTVRSRYLRCRELLAAVGRLATYERLLEVLGCRETPATAVRDELARLADTLAVTARVARTPYPYSSDLRPDTWHLTLDGAAELVAAGWHREAVWWVLAGYARCVTVLTADAPSGVAAEHRERMLTAAAALIGFEVGVAEDRVGRLRALLPELDAVAEELVAGGPE